MHCAASQLAVAHLARDETTGLTVFINERKGALFPPNIHTIVCFILIKLYFNVINKLHEQTTYNIISSLVGGVIKKTVGNY